jgi:hypothetical protein
MSTAPHRVRTSNRMALAHLAKEVLKEDWSATAATFRLRVLVGENVGVLHRIRGRLYRVASVRQDQTTTRALATLDVAVGSTVSERAPFHTISTTLATGVSKPCGYMK